MRDEFACGGSELLHDCAFEVVGFDHPIAGERFGHDTSKFSVVSLHRVARASDFTVVNNDGYHANRHDYHGDQRQFRLLPEQVSQQADQGYRIFY